MNKHPLEPFEPIAPPSVEPTPPNRWVRVLSAVVAGVLGAAALLALELFTCEELGCVFVVTPVGLVVTAVVGGGIAGPIGFVVALAIQRRTMRRRSERSSG